MRMACTRCDAASICAARQHLCRTPVTGNGSALSPARPVRCMRLDGHFSHACAQALPRFTRNFLTPPNTRAGDVFAYDEASGLVVFRKQAAHTFQKADYNAVPAAAIAGIEVVGEGEILPPVAAISSEELTVRRALAGE